MNIIGTTVPMMIIILTSIIYITDQQGKDELEKNTIAWAKSLSEASIPYLKNNEDFSHHKLRQQLTRLITSSDINYVHIYKKLENDHISYFSSFNKNIYFPSIPDKIESIEQLMEVQHQQNFVELIVKIENEQILYGYLYIQTSNKTLNSFTSKLTIIAIAFLIIAALFLTLVAIKINRNINQPVTALIQSVQTISQKKAFSQRVGRSSFTELDILAQTINILLSRAESHIFKQNEIHQLALQQNSTLSEKVSARTDALKQSNQELLSTLEELHKFQAQLVETKKMASLGDMVAGIAHEVNTPIGLGVTASTLLADRLDEISQSFDNKTLKSSQLKKFLIESEENVGIIYRNLERAAKLIASFKKVAVDQSSADIRLFNVKELLEEVTLTLKTKIDIENVQLTIDCPEDLTIKSKPGPINQILINLIINSIIHGFEHSHNGIINISISYLNENLHINYQDNGKGIDENIKSRVFDPFTTTKRGSGGSGLGLHLVFNLVTQALNGKIDFKTNAERGTLFKIEFPVILVLEQ